MRSCGGLRAGRFGVLAAAAVLAGCRTEQTLVTPDPHLERMLVQQKRLAYQPDPILPLGMTMQQPPEGTVPANALTGDPAALTGVAEGRFVHRVPIPVDRAMVEDGRRRFQTFCATCHGVDGTGVSAVAEKMGMRRPPSLHEERIVAYAPGRIFATIRQGYGLMPSYAVQLSPESSWAVVVYVRALQLARHARVADLPPEVRDRLAKEAP
jgi:mono/diheme cytochrome c family protein